MPLIWNSVFPMVVDGDLERFRLIYEQLLHDPAVSRLGITENSSNRFIRSMEVEFASGVDGPSNLTLRALPQQFPADRTPVRSLFAQNEEVARWSRQISLGLAVPEELLDPDRFDSISQNRTQEVAQTYSMGSSSHLI
jgi:hypothetical protein